jgi:hypothetical protein
VRSFSTTPGSLWFRWLPLLALTLAGCGGGNPVPPTNDTLTLHFVPATLDVANLVVQSATMAISGLTVYGDTSSAVGSDKERLSLDVDGAVSLDAVIAMLTPGVYSRVKLNVDNMTMTGSWRGTPLQISVGEFGGGMVALRSGAGQDVGTATAASFVIAVDPNPWFANGILDMAMISNGQIVCDMRSNPDLGGALINRIATSFSIH